MTTTAITLEINQKSVSLRTEDSRTLLDTLRNECDLRGSHFGCGQEQCGACMVLINNRAAYACATPIGAAQGRHITTIEGLSSLPAGRALQTAFLQEGAAQCGYCTSGMLISATALLLRTPNPTDDEIRTSMSGNLCRCGVYHRILRAIKSAAATLSEESS